MNANQAILDAVAKLDVSVQIIAGRQTAADAKIATLTSDNAALAATIAAGVPLSPAAESALAALVAKVVTLAT